MRTILVTGGEGFIGSHFIRYMINKYPYYSFINLDKSSRNKDTSILKEFENNPNFEFVHGNICDWELIKKVAHGCDAVINFVAERREPVSYNPTGEAVKTNILGTQILLELSKYYRHSRFIQISTADVYGSVAKGVSKESNCLSPSNPYTATKAAADLLTYSYFVADRIPIMIIRFSNIFGPHQSVDEPLAAMITKALADEPLSLLNSGLNAYDWLYIEDACAAADCILHQGFAGQIYNVGSGNGRTDLEVCQEILKILKKPSSLINFVLEKGGGKRYVVDTNKARKLGWEPKYGFHEALKKTIEWHREQRAGSSKQ